MSDRDSSRPASEVSEADTLRKSASSSSSTTNNNNSVPTVSDFTRRDSRNTLHHTLPYAYSAASQRMMNSSPPAAAYMAPAPKNYMSSAASARSTAMSGYTQQSYGMPGRNISMPYAGSVMSSRGFAEIPTATSDNDYLGFCKGAWKAQNGDRKGSMEKCKEAQSWSRNASRSTALAAHLKCLQQKCTFRSNYISSDASLIWDKVTTYADRGVKIRWRFLAKSHVPQRVVIKNQFAFKCLICVYAGKGTNAGVYVGTDIYLEHINSEHRGQHFHDILLYKMGCINDRVAEDDEDFDINIWPLSVQYECQSPQQYLSDSLMADPTLRNRVGSNLSGMTANQPWIVDANEYDFEPHGRLPPSSPPTGYPSPPIPHRSDARTASARSPPPQNGGHSPTSSSQWSQANLAPPVDGLQRRLSANTDDSQSMALTTSLVNVLQVFGEGSIVIDQMKTNSSTAAVPFLDLLEQSLQDSPQDIQKEWQRGVHRFGPTYEAGDYIAIIALSQLTFQLHNNVVDKLRRAIYGGESTDFGYLADAADLGRQQAIAALHEFKQRLMHAPQQQVVPPSVPPTAAAAMQQAQQAQREAAMPRKHISHMRPDLWKDPYIPDPATRNASLASGKSSKNKEISDNESGSRRRSSMLGTIREKASRKVSLSSKSSHSYTLPQRQDSLQSLQPIEPEIDDLATTIQHELSVHPALRNRGFEPKHPPLQEIAELDASSIRHVQP